MIWEGKRHKGVEVYIGRRGSDYAGEYIVTYPCNGYSSTGSVDAYVGVFQGDRIPTGTGSVSFHCLRDSYRKVSYRQIPEADRAQLRKFVVDEEEV